MTAVALWASSTPAESAEAKVRLSYEAPAGCPDRETFVQRLHERAPDVRVVGDDDRAAASAAATIRTEGTAFSGTLRVEGPAVPESGREVPGATCPDVADALALVLALALAPGEPSTPSVATSSSPPPQPAPAASTPAPPAREPSPTVSTVVATERATAPVPLGQWLAGVEGRYLVGPAPDGMGAVSAYVGWGSAEPSPGSPMVELGALFGTRGAVPEGTGSVRFSAAGLWARGCPYRVRLGKLFSVSPCGTVDAFLLFVRTSDAIPNPESVTRLWLAPGAALKLGLLSLDPVRIELFGGGSIPIFRDRFYLRPEPGDTVHRTSSVVGSAGVAIAYRFR